MKKESAITIGATIGVIVACIAKGFFVTVGILLALKAFGVEPW